MLKPVHNFIAFLIISFIALVINPAHAASVFQTGAASYYGKAHHGKRTASGVRFNMHGLTAAHRTLPFGTKLRVTCKETGKSVLVTVNDRGPYHGRRILDLSQEAARQLGMIKRGVGQVTIERIEKGVNRLTESPSEVADIPDLHEDVYKQLDPIGELLTQLKI